MTDNSTYHAVGYVTIVIPPGVPLAVADIYTCPFNASCSVNATSGVLANDQSFNLGANLTVITAATQPPSNGSLALDANGSFVFTPEL